MAMVDYKLSDYTVAERELAELLRAWERNALRGAHAGEDGFDLGCKVTSYLHRLGLVKLARVTPAGRSLLERHKPS